MSYQVEVKCKPDQSLAYDIRVLFCQQAEAKPDGSNPLISTQFNELLDKIVQTAFDEGRQFQRAFPER